MDYKVFRNIPECLGVNKTRPTFGVYKGYAAYRISVLPGRRHRREKRMSNSKIWLLEFSSQSLNATKLGKNPFTWNDAVGTN